MKPYAESKVRQGITYVEGGAPKLRKCAKQVTAGREVEVP